MAQASVKSDAVLLGRVDPTAGDSRDDEESSLDSLVAVPATVEEEERGSDPIPEAEYELIELSESMGHLVVWERPVVVQPVTDPVDEAPSPPPRA